MKEVVPQFIDPPAIVRPDTRRADEVRQQISKLEHTAQANIFDQAALLAEMVQNNYWLGYGCSTLEEYLAKDNLDLSPREVRYRVSVHTVSTKLSIPRTELEAAKISKLKEICSLNPDGFSPDGEPLADVIRQLIREAPSTTLVDLKEKVKALKADPGDPEGELTWLQLPIRRDAKDIVTRAIDLARLLSGSTIDAETKEIKDQSQAAALEKICADFLADANNFPDEVGEAGDFEDSVSYEADAEEV